MNTAIDQQNESGSQPKFLNEKEAKTADALLHKLENSTSQDAPRYAAAYQALMQGALNRVNGERTVQS